MKKGTREPDKETERNSLAFLLLLLMDPHSPKEISYEKEEENSRNFLSHLLDPALGSSMVKKDKRIMKNQ